jgi:hypothetical protein
MKKLQQVYIHLPGATDLQFGRIRTDLLTGHKLTRCEITTFKIFYIQSMDNFIKPLNPLVVVKTVFLKFMGFSLLYVQYVHVCTLKKIQWLACISAVISKKKQNVNVLFLLTISNNKIKE